MAQHLIAVGLGGKHEVAIDPAVDTIGSVKAKLEPLTSLAASELKLVVKGKSPPDATPIAQLGLANGAKIMLMRSREGAKNDKPLPGAATAAASMVGPPWLSVGAQVDYLDSAGTHSQPAVVKAIHTDDPPQLYCTIALDDGGSERQTPVSRLLPRGDPRRATTADGGASGSTTGASEAGEGPIQLVVSQGTRKLVLHCEASASVLSLKQLLVPLLGGSAEPPTMKLLFKGKEAVDAATVEGLGVTPSGGKLMLLFKARHHREQEGAAIVKDCAAQLADLLSRAQRLRHRLTKRLLDSAEGQVQLGALEEEVGEIETDLRNAAPNAGSEAATVREARLAECAAIRLELKTARDEFTAAELAAQLNR